MVEVLKSEVSLPESRHPKTGVFCVCRYYCLIAAEIGLWKASVSVHLTRKILPRSP